MLSPLLYSLFTYDCVASESNTSIIKFAAVIGLITGGEEAAYRREVAGLNTDKTKEMIIDPRRRRRREQHAPVYIGGTEVEREKEVTAETVFLEACQPKSSATSTDAQSRPSSPAPPQRGMETALLRTGRLSSG